MDAHDILDDFYLNLLNWGSNNVLSIALGNTVYIWDASYSSTAELVTVDEEEGPVTSVAWAPDGCHVAIGFNNSHVLLWDSNVSRLVNIILFPNKSLYYHSTLAHSVMFCNTVIQV